MNTTQSTPQTIAHIFESMTRDEQWLGYGYLGERRNHLESTDPDAPAQPELVAAADKRILDHADAQGWTREQLFTWANSKNGRFYADAMFGGTGTVADRYEMAARWGVLALPR